MPRLVVGLLTIPLVLGGCADGRAPTAPSATSPVAFATATKSMGRGAVSQKIPVPQAVLRNPCTGEDVVYSGTIHVVMKIEGGTTRTHSNFQSMHGVSATGRRYVLAENSLTETSTSQGGTVQITARVHFRVISQGSFDNWFVRMVTRTTIAAAGNSSVEVLRSESECRG